jgi:hypothetical protein
MLTEITQGLMSCTARGYPADLEALMRHIQQPHLQEYIRRFLFDIFNPESLIPGCDVPLHECPPFTNRIYVYHSATSTYYAPSDVCGTGGMHRETIQATPSWYHEAPRYDTVFVAKDQDVAGFAGLHVARVMLFFNFKLGNICYPCALVEWFVLSNDVTQGHRHVGGGARLGTRAAGDVSYTHRYHFACCALDGPVRRSTIASSLLLRITP